MKQQSKIVSGLLNILKSLIIPFGMWAIFAILSDGRTASYKTFMSTLRQCCAASVICYGLILCMNLGMMNFSAGGMMLFSGIIGGNLAKMAAPALLAVLPAGLVELTGTNFWTAGCLIFFCLLICTLTGVATGLLYNVMRVPCIVLSIGMMLVWEAIPKWVFENGVTLKKDMTFLAKNPACFWVLGITVVIFFIIYNMTAFGHNLRAIGSNQAIANSVGLDSDKIKLAAFTVSGFFLGIAAVLYFANIGEQRNVSAMGSMTLMMDGFMGMFIAMFIARFCNMAFAVVLGNFTMKMMTTGFVAVGLSATVRDVVQGIFLLILLVISANAGLFDRMKADKTFKEKCIAALGQ